MRRNLPFVLLVTAPLLLMGADSRPGCPLGPFDASSQKEQARALFHSISVTAEAVAPNAGSSDGSRHRPATAPAQPSMPVANFIDAGLLAAMQKNGVVPTAMAGDEEFLRRVSLDLTGAIPDSAAVDAFLADKSSDKRAKKIDELLASDAFTDRWALWFGDLVQNVQVSTNIREYNFGRNAYYTWIRDSIRTGKSYDQMVRELISGKGDSFATGASNYWVRQIQPNGPIQDTYDNLAAHAGEKFLGMPMLCLSCHNGLGHLEQVNLSLQKKTRSDFWGMAAFFSRTRATPIPYTDPAAPNANIRKFDVEDNTTGLYQLNTISGNKSPRAPAQGQPAIANPVYMFTGEAPRAGEAPRDAFGRILTADRQFARATVNYVWKEMFGLGLVEPVAAFDLLRLDPAKVPAGSTVQPTNPQLLEDLTSSFIASGYNLRSLIRTMAVSSAYQLSSRYTPGTWNEAWTPYYARHYPQRLQAEVLLDAITKSTSVPAPFNVNGLGVVTRAIQLPDPTEGARNVYGRFLDEFGRGNRDDQPRTNDSSIAQALSLMNDQTVVVNRVRRATTGSTVSKVLAGSSDPAVIVDQLYVATLSRHPSAAEKTLGVNYVNSGGTTQLGPKAEDLQWALLNQLEFLFN